MAKALLRDLFERGVEPDRRRLFVVDDSKALRKAIDEIYGADNPVQRCRNHKLRNVLGRMPKEDHDQVKAVIRVAWKLEAKEDEAKVEHLARLVGTKSSFGRGQLQGRSL